MEKQQCWISQSNYSFNAHLLSSQTIIATNRQSFKKKKKRDHMSFKQEPKNQQRIIFAKSSPYEQLPKSPLQDKINQLIWKNHSIYLKSRYMLMSSHHDDTIWTARHFPSNIEFYKVRFIIRFFSSFLFNSEKHIHCLSGQGTTERRQCQLVFAVTLMACDRRGCETESNRFYLYLLKSKDTL